jgi:hypothetical protein
MMSIATLGVLALAVQGTKAGPQSSIWDRLELEAEGRMRAEATIDNVDPVTGNDVEDRYRGRFRFRFGAKYALDEDITLGARLSTASDGNDANNPHWDWGDGDGFNGGGVVVDRYYLDWAASEETHVVFGKQPHAFAVPPIYGDFLWDSDISPAGVTATWKPAETDGTSFDARVAGYVVAETAADHDAKMIGAQGNVHLPVDEAKLHVSTAVYDWTNVSDFVAAGLGGTNQGNDDADFLVWEAFAAGTMPGGPLEEMTGYVQLMYNLDESDAGVVLGAQLGSSRWQRGNYNAFLLLYDLDGNAVFSPVAQDDTPVAGTGLNDGDADGMNGIVLGGQYFYRDHIAFKLWVLTSNASGADEDPIRVRFDIDFKVR